MNMRIQLKTEARGLFWAWAAIVLAALPGWLPWSRVSDHLGDVRILTFVLGIPLLATLPFGREFQYGTFHSLLSQPILRGRIWVVKTLIAIIAVFSALPVYGLLWRDQPGDILFIAGAWAMTTTCSATLCTLESRSVIGGIATNLMIGMVVLIPTMGLVLFGIGGKAGFVAGGATVLACSVILLWLGRRKLIRFQSIGARPTLGVPGLDSEIGSRLFLLRMPRCTRTGALRNLVRKELCLLWPLWQLTLLAAAFIVLLTPLRFVATSSDAAWGLLNLLAIFGVVVFGALGSILAGCLSVGGERETGTHSWHLTLPISLRVQWAIKLLTALLFTAISLVALMTLARVLLGPPLVTVLEQAFGDSLLPKSVYFLGLMVITTFAAFWCASASRQPIEAVLWLVPVAGSVFMAFLIGKELAISLLGSSLLEPLISGTHPFPFGIDTVVAFTKAALGESVLWAGVLPLAAFQSYRLFRAQIPGRILSTVRFLSEWKGMSP